MRNKVLALALGLYFLSGSIILPLGDFSLLQNIPQMYRTYKLIASPGERGLTDFVGDYLLGGKTIFGHNKRDLPEKPGMAVQFQHPAVFAVVIAPGGPSLGHVTFNINPQNSIYHSQLTSRFPARLLRPPLTTA